MNEKSSFLSLNKTDLISIGKGLLIAELGAILTVAASWVALGTFDWKVLLALEAGAIGSTFVNFLRKWLSSSNQ
jgi:hypothetical protein